MRLAVLQHRIHEDAATDARSLADSVLAAERARARLIVVPCLDSLVDGARDIFDAATVGVTSEVLVPPPAPAPRRDEFWAGALPGDAARLGTVVALSGDACIDPAMFERAAMHGPLLLVLAPRSESELQAQAMIDLALDLSESLASIVVVVDGTGAEPGEPGHGGSAVFYLGDVLAEAGIDGESETLTADLPDEPFPSEPGDVPVEVPMILQQRLAHHAGQRLYPGYPADTE